MVELDCDGFDDVRFDDVRFDDNAEDEDHNVVQDDDKPSIPLKSNLNSEFMIGLD